MFQLVILIKLQLTAAIIDNNDGPHFQSTSSVTAVW